MSALIPEIIPVSRQVAELWVALEPDARPTCLQCGQAFPLAGPTGVPSLVCPRCGFVPAENCCRDVLKSLQSRQAQSVPTEAAEVSAVPVASVGRCDPPGLDEVIGNPSAKLQIRTALDAHKARAGTAKAMAFPSVLLVGPAGSGKTTLAGIIARECKRKLHEQMGQSLNDPRAMVVALLELKAGDILYIEEVHGLKRTCIETLYQALEEGQVIPISSRGAPSPRPVKLPPFTLIGATTDEYKLTDSFKQRFPYHIHLKRLTVEELAGAIMQRAERSGAKLTAPAARMIAERSHGTPRKAVMLLRRCADTALAGGEDVIDDFIVSRACEMAELDSLGLTAAARLYLAMLAGSADPVRLNVLASTLSVPPRVVEVEIERDLVYLGLIEKTEIGRRLTAAGRQHLKGSL